MSISSSHQNSSSNMAQTETRDSLASMNSQQWRKRGQKLRTKLVESDEEAHNFVLSNDCDIEKYYKVADRVLEQFLHHPIDSREEILESYMVGNRLVKFLGKILPTHVQYFSKDMEPARKRSQDQLVMVLKYLDQIALLIDKQEHQDYISTVLGADQLSTSGGGNHDISFDRSSVSTECLDNTTISSMASKIRQTSLSNNSSRAYHWNRISEEKSSSSSFSALNDKSGRGQPKAKSQNEISPENSILASSGTGNSIPTAASSNNVPLAVVSGKRKKTHKPNAITTSNDTNDSNAQTKGLHVVTPSSEQSSTRKRGGKLPEWPPRSPSSGKNVDKSTENSPMNRKTDTLFLQYQPSKISSPTNFLSKSSEISTDGKTDVLYLQYKPSNGLKMKNAGNSAKRYDGSDERDYSDKASQNTTHSNNKENERNVQYNHIQLVPVCEPENNEHNFGCDQQSDGLRKVSSQPINEDQNSTKQKFGSGKIPVDERAEAHFDNENNRQGVGETTKLSCTNDDHRHENVKERNGHHDWYFQQDHAVAERLKKKYLDASCQQGTERRMESFKSSITQHSPPKEKRIIGEFNRFSPKQIPFSGEKPVKTKNNQGSSLLGNANEKISSSFNNIEHSSLNKPSAKYEKSYLTGQEGQSVSSKMEEKRQDVVDEWHESYSRRIIAEDQRIMLIDNGADSENNEMTDDVSLASNDFQEAADLQGTRTCNLISNKTRSNVDEDVLDDVNSFPKLSSKTFRFDNDKHNGHWDDFACFRQNGMPLILEEEGKHDSSKEISGASAIHFDALVNQSTHSAGSGFHALGSVPNTIDVSFAFRDIPGADRYSVPNQFSSTEVLKEPSVARYNGSKEKSFGTSPPRYAPSAAEWSVDGSTMSRELSSKVKSKNNPNSGFIVPTDPFSTSATTHHAPEQSRLCDLVIRSQDVSKTQVVQKNSSSKSSLLLLRDNHSSNTKEKSTISRRMDRVDSKSDASSAERKVQQSHHLNPESKPKIIANSSLRADRTSGSSAASHTQSPLIRLKQRHSDTVPISSSNNRPFDPFWASKLSLHDGPILREESSTFAKTPGEKGTVPFQQRVAAISLEPPPVESAYFESLFDNVNDDDSNSLLRGPEDLKSLGSISRKSNSNKKRGVVLQDSEQQYRPVHKSSPLTCSRMFQKHHHPGKQQETSLLSQYPTFTESTSEESSLADRKQYHHSRSHFRGCVRCLLE